MVISTRRELQRLVATMLIAAVAWPTMASAAGAPEPDPESPKLELAEPSAAREGEATSEPGASAEPGGEPEPEPETEPETEPSGKLELTVEEYEKQQLDWRAERAALHWQEGERLYDNGRYAEAAVEFEISYAAVHASATLYSVALSYERAGKPVEAVRALQRYLELPECPDVAAHKRPIDCTALRPAAEQALAEQRRRVGELVITLGEGVELREIRVAGRTVPLDDFPLVLLPGTVDVEVFGLRPEERRSRPAYITPGEISTLYVAPFETKVGRPTVTPGAEIEPLDEFRLAQRKRQLKSAFWVGTGLTAASGIALGVTGGLASYYQRRFDTKKCEQLCFEKTPDGELKLDAEGEPIPLGGPNQDLYPHEDEANFARYKTVANALVGVTIGLGVATALVGVFAFRKRASAPDTDGRRARTHVQVGGSGLLVRW